MTKLEALIQQLCPDGVEYKRLKDIGSFYGGLTGKSKDDFVDGNAAFISYKNVYSNPSLDINPCELVKISEGERQNTLEYGDIVFTGSSETPDECGLSSVVCHHPVKRLYLNSFCFFLRLNEKDTFIPAFSKHLFRSLYMRKQIIRTANGVTRHNVSKKMMGEVIVPVPPLEVQQEIARILDSYTARTTELQALLTAELTDRKQQYKYYRDELFCNAVNVKPSFFPEFSTNCDSMRKPVTSGNRISGSYPYYGASGIVDYVNDYIYDGNYLLVSEDGANLLARSTPIAFSISGKNWVNNHAHVIKFSHYATQRYVEIYLNSIDLSPYVTGGAQPKLNQANLNKIRIPLPPLAEQERIVAILDRFDALCNDLTSGLPAEIEARQKQYEYYRDKLLTFKEMNQ